MFATVVGGAVHDGGAFAVPRHAEGRVWGVCGLPFGRRCSSRRCRCKWCWPSRPPGRLALHREHELSGLIRAAWLGTFLVWLVAVVVVLLFQSTIMAQWNITNPAAIWLTLPVLLFTAWLPMFYGVLQGQQNFLWMGWSMMAERRGPGGHRRVGGPRDALLCPGHGAGYVGRPDRRPRDRDLADAVPVAPVAAGLSNGAACCGRSSR